VIRVKLCIGIICNMDAECKYRSPINIYIYAWRLYYDHGVTPLDGVTTTTTTTGNPTDHIIHRRRQYRYICFILFYTCNHDSRTKKYYDMRFYWLLGRMIILYHTAIIYYVMIIFIRFLNHRHFCVNISFILL